MASVYLRGRITRKGKLKVKLPAGLPPGDIRVVLEFDQLSDDDLPADLRPWTDDQLAELLKPEPTSAPEIAAMLNSPDFNPVGRERMTDSVKRLKKQRRKRHKQLRW